MNYTENHKQELSRTHIPIHVFTLYTYRYRLTQVHMHIFRTNSYIYSSVYAHANKPLHPHLHTHIFTNILPSLLLSYRFSRIRTYTYMDSKHIDTRIHSRIRTHITYTLTKYYTYTHTITLLYPSPVHTLNRPTYMYA